MQQRLHKEEHKMELITSDSSVPELQLQENVALTPKPGLTKGPHEKVKLTSNDDMEL